MEKYTISRNEFLTSTKNVWPSYENFASQQLLKPETQKGVSEKLKERKELQSKFFNRDSKELAKFQKNDIVRIQPSKHDRVGRRREAKVLRKVDVRSYLVRREDGTVLRRNIKFLRTSKEAFDDIGEDLPDISPSTEEQGPALLNHKGETETNGLSESEKKANKSSIPQ